jgi:hypothetical protein
MTRSKRGGAINIPDTGLTEPISIYYRNPKYNDDPNNKIKKYTLKTIGPFKGKPLMCEVIDNEKKTATFDYCSNIRKNALSEEEYFKGNEEYRKNFDIEVKTFISGPHLFLLKAIHIMNNITKIYRKAGYSNGPNGGHPQDPHNRKYITFDEAINL